MQKETALDALARVILPLVCATCGRFAPEGDWSSSKIVEVPPAETVSHGMCPDCEIRFRVENGLPPKGTKGIVLAGGEARAAGWLTVSTVGGLATLDYFIAANRERRTDGWVLVGATLVRHRPVVVTHGGAGRIAIETDVYHLGK